MKRISDPYIEKDRRTVSNCINILRGLNYSEDIIGFYFSLCEYICLFFEIDEIYNSFLWYLENVHTHTLPTYVLCCILTSITYVLIILLNFVVLILRKTHKLCSKSLYLQIHIHHFFFILFLQILVYFIHRIYYSIIIKQLIEK